MGSVLRVLLTLDISSLCVPHDSLHIPPTPIAVVAQFAKLNVRLLWSSSRFYFAYALSQAACKLGTIV